MSGKFVFKNLGYPYGYIITLMTVMIASSYSFVIWQYGVIGAIVHNILRVLSYYADIKTSNAYEYNMMILEKNGYDTKTLIPYIMKRFVLRVIINYPIYAYAVKDAVPHHDLTLVTRILISLAVTEVYFTVSHKLMHRYFPEVHKMHHCCIRASYTSNLVFSNIDSILELTIPLLISLFLNIGIWRDGYSYMWATGTIMAWYALDHDEYLQLSHWRHHQYINSNYSVYVEYKDFDPTDKLKDDIKRF